MTNYNERLDKLLEQAYTDGASDTMWQNDRHVEIFATAKQALTSLIKELVAEAKPARSETQIGNFIIYGDLSKRDLKIINQFEQNLLKALEEK